MLTVRPMAEADLDAVSAIERETFSQPWSRDGFWSALRRKDTLYVTALLDGETAGYCGLWISFDEAEITNVAVAAGARRRGAAEAMLAELMRLARERGVSRFTLEVRKSNTAARRLYEKLGFEAAGVRPRFYEKPVEDAVIMWTPDEKEENVC